MEELPVSVQRVASAAREAGLDLNIRIMTESTRTAAEAALVCGTSEAQIVKSLIFEGRDSGTPLLFLVAGSNRLDEGKVAAHLGEPLARPNAQKVREISGYAIGGIPPIGHATRLTTYIDPTLLTFDEVWAAAGTPNSIFPVDPKRLQAATAAEELDLKA